MKKVCCLVMVFVLGSIPLFAQGQLDGQWQGAIQVMGTELTIMVDFKTTPDSLKATIDIPPQGAFGLALKNVRHDTSKVHFELPAGPGLAVFDGKLEGDKISGDFLQSGISGTFYLNRGTAAPDTTAKEVPLPYKQEEVRFHNGDIVLAGTLTLPPEPGRYPAVIMITGSGPQNRDEELFGFKPFRLIADHLTRNGIAVLRYDDRGVGGSGGKIMESTTADFADDVLAAMQFLQTRSEIDPQKIGLLGHSEGGIVAPMVASKNPEAAFVILMAGTGVTGEKILLAQAELIMRANGGAEAEIRANRETQTQTFAAVRAGKGLEALRSSLREMAWKQFAQMTEQQRAAIADTAVFLDSAVEGQLRSVTSPWFKFFLDYDPATALTKVKCPVLMLFGELDLQVPAALNEKTIIQALKKGGNKNYTSKIFPKANHLFLTANTGSPTEYATLPKEFVPGFLDTISSWTLQVASAKK